MIVDPFTGQPQQEGPAPQSMLGTYGTAVGQGAGLQTPLYYDMMEMIPAASTTVAWNMRRVQNTVLNNRTNIKKGGHIGGGGGIRQTFSPARFGTLADVSNIDPGAALATHGKKIGRGAARGYTNKPLRANYKAPTGPPVNKIASAKLNFDPIAVGARPQPIPAAQAGVRGGVPDRGRKPRRGYSPFNILSDGGNWLAERTPAGKSLAANNQRMFAPGVLGSMATGSTLMARGGASISASRMENVFGATSRFAGADDMQRFRAVAKGGFLGGRVNQGTYLASGFEASRLGNSKFSGTAAGYFRGAQSARLGTSGSARYAAMKVGQAGSFYDKGLAAGARAYNAKGLAGIGGKLAGSGATALGMRAAGPIGTALLVRDLAKGAGRMVGRSIKLGIEAANSAQGDLTKSSFGGVGYKDNSVAATSRQRGVMAISNSRLNARSALGQEASFMYQNFG